jgi:hypothetical protein
VVGGCKPHSLVQGGLWQSASDSPAQLGPSEVQKTKLMDQVLALFLCCYLSLISSGRLVNQAWESLFDCVPGLACSHNITL